MVPWFRVTKASSTRGLLRPRSERVYQSRERGALECWLQHTPECVSSFPDKCSRSTRHRSQMPHKPTGTKLIKTSMYLRPEDLKRLHVLAAEKDTTLARLIRRAIKSLLETDST